MLNGSEAEAALEFYILRLNEETPGGLASVHWGNVPPLLMALCV